MFKGKIRPILLGIIVIFIFSAANFMRNRYVAPILMYHLIEPEADPNYVLTLSVKTFEAQMRFLKEHHYTVLPLDELVSMIKDKKKIPHKAVAITLDDGYKDNYACAFPVLKKYNLPATIFLIVDEVGRSRNDRLSWEEIKIMQDSGLISFGSHALGPEPLTNIKSEEEIKRQIFGSKKILEEKLAKEVKIFSYPEGMFNDKIRQWVIDAGYKGAVATKAKGKPSNDIFVLKRLRISENCANMFIFWFEASGYYTFLKELNHK